MSFINASPEDGDIVALNVLVGNANSGLLEEFVLELVHLPRGRSKSKPSDLIKHKTLNTILSSYELEKYI